MQISKDLHCTVGELSTRLSAFEYNLRKEALLLEVNPEGYRKDYAARLMSPELQVEQMKRVLH